MAMKSKKNLTRFTYKTTAFQGWRLCISRGGETFTRYYSDRQYNGARKSLQAAEKKLKVLRDFLDKEAKRDRKNPRKLTKTSARQALKLLKSD